MKTITINGVEYKPVNNEDSEVKIVVLQRGWVAVGFYFRYGVECKLKNAYIIRLWGTTKGLGELKDGPTESTKLDKAGTICFNRISEILTIDCDKEKWIAHLK